MDLKKREERLLQELKPSENRDECKPTADLYMHLAFIRQQPGYISLILQNILWKVFGWHTTSVKDSV